MARMADPDKDRLAKLVALKRRKAEQSFQTLDLQRRRIESRIEGLSSELASLDEGALPPEVRALCHGQGSVRRALSELQDGARDKARNEAETERAKDALKSALHAERTVKGE